MHCFPPSPLWSSAELSLAAPYLFRIESVQNWTCPGMPSQLHSGPSCLDSFQSTSLFAHPACTSSAWLRRSYGRWCQKLHWRGKTISTAFSFIYQASHFILKFYQGSQVLLLLGESMLSAPDFLCIHGNGFHERCNQRSTRAVLHLWGGISHLSKHLWVGPIKTGMPSFFMYSLTWIFNYFNINTSLYEFMYQNVWANWTFCTYWGLNWLQVLI